MSEREMRSPAPRVNAGNRAEVAYNTLLFIIANAEAGANFVALYLVWRYHLPLLLARTIAVLASIGGRLA